jgi:hypothetical protein
MYHEMLLISMGLTDQRQKFRMIIDQKEDNLQNKKYHSRIVENTDISLMVIRNANKGREFPPDNPY